MRTRTRLVGSTLLRVDRLGSTNDLLRSLAQQGASEGTAVVAREQTAGRGRMGRSWASPPGGLWLSVLLRPPRPADLRLALAAAVGAAEGVRGASGAPVGLKWPNDLVLQRRKVGGVLVEAIPPWAVVGIGVNVNLDRALLPPDVRKSAVSLAEVVGHMVDLDAVLDGVLAGLDHAYDALRHGRGDEVLDRWRRLSVTLGQPVRVRIGGRVVQGIAVDIDAAGALLVAGSAGAPVRVLAGDVTLL
ncbi:MAG: biotin--[acetyl-CoA-carboxylase] ligase [Armatimonadota bacterium]|nr:biotin--[acetyl-CoA-carboxylase] ligase [Armatimonadota bacterium]MDR7427308.1 biotin--[acetyl-CoA-carboxylase] ligase [Armatimonadota bacterium]MDR7463872.1 biotin--[acetyl-CoA-carboxylase] ligase [Armatimonadota bacterium]MDR7469930.1 biotin--[acetyl-CoA-carboxylase] ligase [Armatimonadota bacterium]MDR7474615.1 biotin--[acetyl-CoA-carboxylase] ligase [Armatimonadota bacterium]